MANAQIIFWARCWGLCLLLSFVACSDDVQGSLRLLLTPPHEGRNPTLDPFTLVDEVEIGVLNGSDVFHSLGRFPPLARFGPDLLGSLRTGFPYLLGLDNRSRLLAAGFGPAFGPLAGADRFITLPFAPIDTAIARRVSQATVIQADPFADIPPAFFIDQRHLERGAIENAADLSALAFVLWQKERLHLRVRVIDDLVVPAVEEAQLDSGDAVRIYFDGNVLTAAADGTLELPDGVSEATLAELPQGGYQLDVVWPALPPGKNRILPFNLRIYDHDGGEDMPAVATWSFNPNQAVEELGPDDFGHLLLAVPLLEVLRFSGPSVRFPAADGQATVDGFWGESALTLRVQVPDQEVRNESTGADFSGADRVELWLDLGNGLAPVAEPARFLHFVVTAGSETSQARGSALGDLTEFNFTGTAAGSKTSSGYEVSLTLPWSNLELNAATAQRGWFLGLEIRVVDEDEGETVIYNWSEVEELDPQFWSEIRLFSLE